jgi:hypothetical protein
MEAINALLLIDANKKHLVTNSNIIEIYLQVVDFYQETDDEYALAIEGLCLVTFVKVGVVRIKQIDGTVEC